ncbi:MAG: S-methyl-5-thioribose-1-phosphate isomerase [Anaerolineae bacterium]|jgi:methylthioribose-1-phosphate isomerase|nr:S-methyl-5-thioribose-1-phosphate isomerase [Anaerolineae bacterium]
MPRTLWWENNQLKMIDQRILPLTYDVLTYDDHVAVAQAITDMVVRGAPAIGAAGAFGMALAAQRSPARDRDSLLADLTSAKKTLDAARPTAVNLSWATSRIMDYVGGLVLPNVDDLRSAIVAEAQRIADEDVEINRRMGAFGAEIVPQGANILTHCNAGSLATVDYGTTLGVVRAASEQGKQVHVWVDETRPRLQGARLTAWELMHDEIPMTLIADNAAGMLMRLGKVQVVLYGADRVAANGDVANKIGSYKLAVLAKENGIPCYSVVPTPTIDLALAHGDLIPIEERGAEEVTMVGVERIAPEGVPVYNPAFDVTPHRYLTGIITEEGICYPPFEISLRKAVEAAEARRQRKN